MAWTHHSATVAPADIAVDTAADITAHNAAQELAPAAMLTTLATLAKAAPCWTCRRCGQRQPAALRLGFVRHGVPQRRRHDPSP